MAGKVTLQGVGPVTSRLRLGDFDTGDDATSTLKSFPLNVGDLRPWCPLAGTYRDRVGRRVIAAGESNGAAQVKIHGDGPVGTNPSVG